jgi:hypothetical protein
VSGARALALASAVVLSVAALAISACGGGDDREPAGSLRWVKTPVLVKPETLPNDRIVAGIVRNDGQNRADVVAKQLKLRTAGGGQVPANAAFIQSFAHGMYPPTRLPGGKEPISEQLRLGQIARVLPGKSVPLTVSWHQKPGSDPPVRIEWSGGSIPIPDKPPVGTHSSGR